MPPEHPRADVSLSAVSVCLRSHLDFDPYGKAMPSARGIAQIALEEGNRCCNFVYDERLKSEPGECRYLFQRRLHRWLV
jgi:hypothetical protein